MFVEEGSDFTLNTALPTNITFLANTDPDPICVQVTVLNDAILEFNETISLLLSHVSPEGVIVTQNTTIVTIVDDESKLNTYDTRGGRPDVIFREML